MKRCPQCNRVGADDALTFCRADGTPLVGDGGSVGEGAVPSRFSPSPVAGETQTRILPVNAPKESASATAESLGKPVAQTTALDSKATASLARWLSGPARRRAVLLTAAAALAATAAAVYFYSSPKSDPAVKSIAVLPFANAGADPDAEYLSDGITESLINSLSRLPGVKVIASSSSFKYKGKDAAPEEVARALGVEAILTGRVLLRGDSLLINAELVNAGDRTQMWGEQYSRRVTDVLAVQSEISRDIAEGLRLRLNTGEEGRLAKQETGNPRAYEAEMRGRFYWRKGGMENWKRAVEYYEQAMAIDPAYALGHARLAGAYKSLVGNSVLDPKEFTPKAEAAALRALELDEGLADAHYALASLRADAWDWVGAEREFKRAVELNPNLAGARNAYSAFLSVMGRHEEAIAEIERAKALDPLSLVVDANVGYRLYFARRYDQAIGALRRTLELEQRYDIAHVILGYAYAAKGMFPEAIAAYEEAIRLGGNTPSVQISLGAAHARAGEREKALGILKRLGKGGEYVSPGELAILYAALGERERALASLERAYNEHDLQLQYLKVDPAYDPLRSDPRFRDLVRRVGLPQ